MGFIVLHFSVCVHACVFACYNMYVEVREQLQELFFSFHHVNPRDRAQVVRLGGDCPCPSSYLAGPKKGFKSMDSLFFVCVKNPLEGLEGRLELPSPEDPAPSSGLYSPTAYSHVDTH